MTGYHVTTRKKLARYEATGCILPPVRFWAFPRSAEEWRKRVKRHLILRIQVNTAYPLPDHRPRGHAFWTPEHVREWYVCDTA